MIMLIDSFFKILGIIKRDDKKIGVIGHEGFNEIDAT